MNEWMNDDSSDFRLDIQRVFYFQCCLSYRDRLLTQKVHLAYNKHGNSEPRDQTQLILWRSLVQKGNSLDRVLVLWRKSSKVWSLVPSSIKHRCNLWGAVGKSHGHRRIRKKKYGWRLTMRARELVRNPVCLWKYPKRVLRCIRGSRNV